VAVSSSSNSADRLQHALAGRYAIETELGRGGMATVYLARDLKHDRPVAIKLGMAWPPPFALRARTAGLALAVAAEDDRSRYDRMPLLRARDDAAPGRSSPSGGGGIPVAAGVLGHHQSSVVLDDERTDQSR
jgi:hypothetical protein